VAEASMSSCFQDTDVWSATLPLEVVMRSTVPSCMTPRPPSASVVTSCSMTGRPWPTATR
jgi:hypothetical protein